MTDQTIETAVQRIEAALARIADLADREITPSPPVSALVEKHQSLLETVANTLNELDVLIEDLDQ
ncbi:MAG: hypothetical protein WAT93_13555 [Pontixanthobacter sp.]